MRTIMARTPPESSFSFSRRHFQRIVGKVTGGDASKRHAGGEGEDEDEVVLTFAAATTSSWSPPKTMVDDEKVAPATAAAAAVKKKGGGGGGRVSRFRSVVAAAIAARIRPSGVGARLTGTLFGHRRGHVHFAFQTDPRSCPVVLLEFATPTSMLVREMASGLVRIALECERKGAEGSGRRLLEEPLWRAYCNGKKCGYALRRECGPGDWKVLRAVEPVSMGAGVLPAGEEGGVMNGEMMYMRARFERVVGSKDSEALYMMNPDGNGGPELSIYLLRV